MTRIKLRSIFFILFLVKVIDPHHFSAASRGVASIAGIAVVRIPRNAIVLVVHFTLRVTRGGAGEDGIV